VDDTTRVGGDGLQHLGPYRIDGPLGQGGMGEVFGATDMRLQRPVALKLIRGHGLADPAIRARFAREAQAASALNHPNICTVYDVGEANGVPYFVMELLEGETLGARLERGALPLQEVVGLTIEIADALDTAHAHQIIHRDIKPANIFITSRGRAKLMDFGVATRQRGDAGLSTTGLAATAALTELGQAIGTVAYMSPEQARGQRLDARTDLFLSGS
jgi:serine/threonine protein kinase